MAQVIRLRDGGDDHNRDRGQMIILMGVILAVMFVALALLVNAAIYTDNVATRGGDPAGEALEYQSGVVDSVSGLLAEENGQTDGTTATDVESAIENIAESHRQYHLRRSAATHTTVDTVNEGRLISQTNVNEFANWNVNANSARGFIMTLDTSGMTVGNETSFYIDIGNQQLEVNKTDSGNLVVSGGAEDVDCSTEANGDVEFDISGERLGDEDCEFGWSTFNDGEIGIQNGDNGAGSYEVTVETNEDVEAPLDSIEIAYSVDLDIRIDTPELSYERSVTVVPEGADA